MKPWAFKLGIALFILAGLSTALGLVVTIIGLIRCFRAVSYVNPADKATILANGISEAMNTAAFGLAAGLAVTGVGVVLVLISRSKDRALPRS